MVIRDSSVARRMEQNPFSESNRGLGLYKKLSRVDRKQMVRHAILQSHKSRFTTKFLPFFHNTSSILDWGNQLPEMPNKAFPQLIVIRFVAVPTLGLSKNFVIGTTLHTGTCRLRPPLSDHYINIVIPSSIRSSSSSSS